MRPGGGGHSPPNTRVRAHHEGIEGGNKVVTDNLKNFLEEISADKDLAQRVNQMSKGELISAASP